MTITITEKNACGMRIIQKIELSQYVAILLHEEISPPRFSSLSGCLYRGKT